MNQEVIQNIAEAVLTAESNEDIFNIFYRDAYKYGITNELLDKYSFIICSDFEDRSDFSNGHLNELGTKTFYDDNKEIFVKHYFYPYKNILYIEKPIKKQPNIDHTVFVDSNAFKIFQNFYIKNIKNDFIDFKIKYNIDLNYTPYILEDFVNPYHTRPNYDKTREKVKIIETINNMDLEHYKNTGEIIIDKKLLNKAGYSNIDSFIDDKFFFFINYFKRNDMQSISLHDSILQTSTKKLDYHRLMLDYNLIFGYILKILIEDIDSNTTLETKIINIYKDMLSHDRIMMQIIYLAYQYYTNPTQVNKFLKFASNQSYEEVLKITYNVSWDIFLYLLGRYFIANTREINNVKADFGVPFYMTGDAKFWQAFVAEYAQRVFIIDKSNPQKSMNSIPIPTDIYIKITKILSEFDARNYEKITRIRKSARHRFASHSQIKSDHSKLLATSLIYKENMMSILKHKWNKEH